MEIDSSDTIIKPMEKAFEWPREASRSKNWPEAAYRWSVLRKAYPNTPITWFESANAFLNNGNLPEAEKILLQAKELFPENNNIRISMATVAILQQRWLLANEYLELVRKKNPDNFMTWIKSAECEEGLGNISQAIVYYEKACKIAPDRPLPLSAYAEMAMRTKQWQLALKLWEDFRIKFPNVGAGYFRAAEAAKELGLKKEAKLLILSQQYGCEIFQENASNQVKHIGRKAPSNNMRLLELIWTKAVFGLRSEVHRNYLSYGWWILEPLFHMLIYYIVFGHLLNRGGENYPVFLLTGLVPWMWFMKAVNNSSGSILSGQNLMLEVGLPSVVFPLVTIVQATIKQIPVFFLLIAFVWFQDFSPNASWWALGLVFLVQAILTTTISLFVAAIIPFVRDLAYLVPTGLTFLMFLSGIFYDYRNIAQEWQELFLLNPIAFLLKSYREIIIEGVYPDIYVLSWVALASMVSCLFLLRAYRHLRYIYPRIIME